MRSSLVTVIIRTINRNQFLLKRAIESVFLQSYSDIELLLVNDGGESVRPLLENYFSDSPINLIELEKNQGRSAAANLGIESARGDYLVFLDDDDFLYPRHVEDLLGAVSGEMIAYSDALRRLEQPRCESFELVNKHLVCSEDHSLRRMLEGNFIPLNCLIFNKKVFEQDKFDQDLNVLEDWDLWIRLSAKYRFVHFSFIRAEYSIRTDQSNTTDNNLEIWEKARKIIRERYRELWQAEGLDTIPTK